MLKGGLEVQPNAVIADKGGGGGGVRPNLAEIICEQSTIHRLWILDVYCSWDTGSCRKWNGKKRIAFIECIFDSTMQIAFMFVNKKYRIAFKGIHLRNLEEKLILEFQ